MRFYDYRVDVNGLRGVCVHWIHFSRWILLFSQELLLTATATRNKGHCVCLLCIHESGKVTVKDSTDFWWNEWKWCLIFHAVDYKLVISRMQGSGLQKALR